MQPREKVAERNPALDGLRFLAALSVVVFHLLTDGGAWHVFATDELFGSWAFLAASYGWVGVPFFFMISGFVICMSSWGRTASQFAVSRVVRLYPAFWVCVLLTTTVSLLHPDLYPPLPWRDVLANLTMFHEPLGVDSVDTVYWTLWVELRFYLLFSLVVWLGVTFQRAVTFCVVWAIAAAWAPQLEQPWLNSLLVHDQAHYFIAGIALFLMYKHGPHPVLWLLIGFSWIMAMHYYAGNAWQAVAGQSYAPASVLITLGYGVLILLALGRLDWLRWRGLTTLGATTYPLYLLHHVIGLSAIHYLRPRVSLHPVALLVIMIVALTVLAWLVHRLVERPLAPRLKRALSRPVAPTPPAPQTSPVPHTSPAPQTPPVVEIPTQRSPGRHAAPAGDVPVGDAPAG